MVIMLWSFVCVFLVRREFLYPKGNMARTKVEHFVSVLNYNLNNETDFFKRFPVQMTSTQLDALLTELENAVEIPDTIPKAVSVIGKNTRGLNCCPGISLPLYLSCYLLKHCYNLYPNLSSHTLRGSRIFISFFP